MRDYFRQRTKEAVKIFTCDNNINQEKGYPLSATWARFLRNKHSVKKWKLHKVQGVGLRAENGFQEDRADQKP